MMFYRVENVGSMNSFYEKILLDLVEFGTWYTDENTYYAQTNEQTRRLSTFDVKIVFDPLVVPLITVTSINKRGEKQLFESALEEILWIWIKRSNNVNDFSLRIWNEWADKEGSIGKAYGYQLNKPVIKKNVDVAMGVKVQVMMNQFQNLIHTLQNNSRTTRGITTLWNIDDLNEMNLPPCVYGTQWQGDSNGYLHTKVMQRSSDLGLGFRFNVLQYKILQVIVAYYTNMIPGQLSFDIGDLHVYDKHLNSILDAMEYQDVTAEGSNGNPTLRLVTPPRLVDDFTMNNIKMEVDSSKLKNGFIIKLPIAVSGGIS
jgi:thymidylate synthase